MNYALLITAIGMGLVFAAILLLWGLMALLVRVTTREVSAEQPLPFEPETAANTDLKHRAAAAAVAVALSEAAQPTVHAFPLPPTALVSAWQAVMRSSHLRERGPR